MHPAPPRSWLLAWCLHATAAGASCPCTGKNTGLNTNKYGADYGTSCKSWEDGKTYAGNSEDCTTFEADQDGIFCCRAWCYVDAANCEGFSSFPSFVQEGSTEALFYSYDACDATGETHYTEENCPFDGPRDFMPAVKVQARVRDFTVGHPHFGCERGCGWPKDDSGSGSSGHVTGMLQAQLVDGKPKLVEKYSSLEPQFNEWYSEDTCSEVASLTFSYDLAKKVHRYDSTDYLPLGPGVSGEEEAGGLFTTEIRIFFRYNGGEVFEFRGDDDVWVFINNKLAIDIGGCHGAIEGRVDLDASAADLGIQTGKNYELVLFQAERCYGASNFKAEMTLRQDQGVCPNQCNGPEEQGRCDLEQGMCVCYEGWSGADCGVKTSGSASNSSNCTSFGTTSDAAAAAPWLLALLGAFFV